jgi:hypothetical protein
LNNQETVEFDLEDLDRVTGGGNFSHTTLEEIENSPYCERMKAKLAELKRNGTARENAMLELTTYIMMSTDMTPFSMAMQAFVDKYWDLV